MPLLDEAAELLGDIDQHAPQAATDLDEYAEGVLQILYGSRSFEAEHADEQEMLLASDALKARQLAERHEERERLTTAERAARDRKWAFGHIIVDEAQELSPMAWRLLMRRCPSRSMTIVGDVAQTGDLAGTTTWEAVLAPHLGDRWRQERLTVNYRTPAEIMEVAAALLADIDANVEPPRSVRETGVRPWRLAAPDGRLCQDVASAVLDELRLLDEGRLGVIVPACLLAEIGEAVAKVVPDAALGEDPELECRVVVLTVRQAKGLEFDTVIVVEPGRILTESPRGHSDLYVALTRATQRLGIVHADPLPEVLARLSIMDIKVPEREEVHTAR